MLSSRQFVRDPQPGQEVVGYYADKATKARQRLRRRSPGRKASEGMTSAIILIAFIITAAGVAFVILTMGSSMQQQLGATGERGLEQSSSAMQNRVYQQIPQEVTR